METGITHGIDPLAWLAANQIAELRRDVAKTEADLKQGFCELEKSVGDAECRTIDKLGSVSAGIYKDASDIAQRQSIALNAVERDLQNRILENRYETGKLNTELSRYLEDKTDAVKERLTGFERNTDMQFQTVVTSAEKNHAIAMLEAAKYHGQTLLEGEKNTCKILEKMDSIERRSLKDELDETRIEKLTDKFSSLIASQFALASQDIANLKNMVNSVEQTQKFASKTVQFGAGNVAIPTQTANQG